MGAMGAVYRGRQIRLRRTVAIKVPKPDLAANPDYIQRFEREALTMAKLVHENVVQIFDVYVSPTPTEPSFIVMEFVEGCELETFLHTQERSLTVAAVCDLLTQVARGIDAANARGVVHRDIKPSNIVITLPQRVAKIMDFGIARVEMENVFATQDTKTMGTPAYMSPEQVTAKQLGPASDIYTFSMMIFRLLARRLPFDCSTSSALLFAQVHTPPLPLDECNPRIPRAAALAIAEGIAKKPMDRPATAVQLAAKLTAGLEPLAQRPFGELFYGPLTGEPGVGGYTKTATSFATEPEGPESTSVRMPSPVPPSSDRTLVQPVAAPGKGVAAAWEALPSAGRYGVVAGAVAILVAGVFMLTSGEDEPRPPVQQVAAVVATPAETSPAPSPVLPTPTPELPTPSPQPTPTVSPTPSPRPTPSPTPHPDPTPSAVPTPSPAPQTPRATVQAAAGTAVPTSTASMTARLETVAYSKDYDPEVTPHLTSGWELDQMKREAADFVSDKIERAIYRDWWSEDSNALVALGGPFSEEIERIVHKYAKTHTNISVKFLILPSSVYWEDRALLRFEVSGSGHPKRVADPNFREPIFRITDPLVARARKVENRWRLESLWGNYTQLQEISKE